MYVSPLLLNIYISNIFFIPLRRIFTNTGRPTLPVTRLSWTHAECMAHGLM